jgi:Family of unknown function (DUF6307)
LRVSLEHPDTMTFPSRCQPRRPDPRNRAPITSDGKYVSLYNLRVQLVQKALKDHSALDDQASFDLAVHVLDALDHIPEKAR